MDYRLFVQSLAGSDLELARTIEDFATLEDVFKWKHGELSDIQTVVQDEFSHDVIIEHLGRYVAFGAT